MPSGVYKVQSTHDWVAKVDIKSRKKQVTYVHKASSRRYNLLKIVEESVQNAFSANSIQNSHYPLEIQVSLDLVKRQ